jgi:hypothetical protein
MVFGLEIAERDIAGEILAGEVLDSVEDRAGSIVEGHFQKEGAVAEGRTEQSHLEVVLMLLGWEGLASLEIQTLHDIVGLLHLLMLPMAFPEVIQVICVRHLEEEEWPDGDVEYWEEMTADEGVVNHGQEKILSTMAQTAEEGIGNWTVKETKSHSDMVGDVEEARMEAPICTLFPVVVVG